MAKSGPLAPSERWAAIKGLECLSYKEKLRAGTVQPGEGSGRSYLCFGRANKEDRARIFFMVCTEQTIGNGYKLK